MTIQEKIKQSGLTIYDIIDGENADLYLPADRLERELEDALIGNNYGGMPIRTRSKVVNQDICKALGYPVPKSFKKTKPRFLG